MKLNIFKRSEPEPIVDISTDYINTNRLRTAINSQTALNLSTVFRCVEILSNSVA
jgi:phage portal protein BeeE